MTILQGLIAADEYNQRRETLNLQKQKRDDELRLKGYDPETLSVMPGTKADVEQEQVKQALQMAHSLQGKLAAQDTDNAILDYATTGDASHLQGALDKNPYIKQAWAARGVLNVANVDFQNDRQILAQKGFNEAEYDTPEKQDILKKNVYKFYDGSQWNIGLLNNVAAETGAISRLGSNRSQPIIDNHQEFRDFMAGPRSSANTAEGHKYESDIKAATEATGVPGNLIASMMNVESKNNPNAMSNKGATGLMQLMPGTAQELGVTDINNPAQNIMAGAKYMAKMLTKYDGNTQLALAAYNAGPGNVDKHGGVPPFEETQKYVGKVLNNYAAGESYYTAGNDAITQGKQLGSSPDLKALTDRQASQADNRIATIRDFVRGNANAEKGTTNENADSLVTSDVLKAKAAYQANLAKLATESTTSKQKDLNESNVQEQKLVSNFGGEKSFFNTDFNNPENFNKAWKQVAQINELQGNKLTTEDKKSITDIRSLITLADPASQISASQTGMIDSNFKNVMKYISDSSSGTDKQAAMAAFRSSIRHALYGSTLTDGEIKSFDEAYGNNKQKLGPILDQYKIALTQVQSKLDSASRLGNPYTMHVLIGADKTKLDNVQAAIQQRIDMIEGRLNKNGSKVVSSNPNVSYAKPNTVNSATFKTKPSLDELFPTLNGKVN